jgi:aryl-alcohol dehydrogenase-like predicted oxidoreductase
LNHVIDGGKAIYWGTSEWDADETARAWRYADKLGLIDPAVEQPQYNMLTRNKVEKEFYHLYKEVGLGLPVFSPLKVGILTEVQHGIPENSRLANNTDSSVERMGSSIGGREWDSFISVVAKLKLVADRLGISLANLALAWVLANKNVSSAITGASHPYYTMRV